MRREFAINLVLLLAVNLLIKPIYLFGVEVGVQNAVGPSDYGRYGQWLSFAFLFGVIYDLGLQNFNAVTMSKQPELLRERLPVMLSLKLVASLGYAVVVVVAAWLYGIDAQDWPLVGLAILYLAVLSLLQLLRTNVAAQGNYRLNSLLSIVDKVVLLFGVGAILLLPAWREALTVERFFIAQIVAVLIACILAAASTERTGGERWWRWDPAGARALLKQALPYGLVLLLTTALVHIDRVMIEPLSSAGHYETGKYLGAYRLLDGINMIGFMFATLLVPMLSKLLAQRSEGHDAGGGVRLLLQQAGGYIMALSVGLAAWTSFHASDITALLYDEATASWGQTLAWLMWTAVGVGLAYVYGSYLLAHQQTRWLNRLFVVALFLNVLLNFLLIPRYGAVGAAGATVLTQAIVGFGEYFRSASIEGAWRMGRHGWSVLVYLPAVLGLSYLTHHLELSVGLSLASQVAGCAVIGLGVGLLADPRSLWARAMALRS